MTSKAKKAKPTTDSKYLSILCKYYNFWIQTILSIWHINRDAKKLKYSCVIATLSFFWQLFRILKLCKLLITTAVYQNRSLQKIHSINNVDICHIAKLLMRQKLLLILLKFSISTLSGSSVQYLNGLEHSLCQCTYGKK